jgi:hypothetical protein
MTILNNTTDGLHPELIVLFRTVAHFKSIDYEDLVNLCLPKIVVKNDTQIRNRLRGALNTWIKIGLFNRIDDEIKLSNPFENIKKSEIDRATIELPKVALDLVLLTENGLPLWGMTADQGTSADFIRGSSWLLTQNIYTLPTSFSDIDPLTATQSSNFMILGNDTRWTNLRFWMRYFGLATGGSSYFQVDPTIAIQSRLKEIFGGNKELLAKDFLVLLSEKLPILDFGKYRKEIEDKLSTSVWRKPGTNELSQSLSFGLRRLEFKGAIQLRGKSDTGSSYRLIGSNNQELVNFETVTWNKNYEHS